MTQYRFVIADGTRSVDVIEHPDADTALLEAVRTIGDLLKGSPDEFLRDGCLNLDMETKDGLKLYRVQVIGIEAPASRKWPTD